MRRPSFPAVISMVALFIALGGTSYAVIKLPAKSVGNRELKSNAVTASKIRDGAVGAAELAPDAAGRRGPRGLQGPAGPAGAVATIEPWQALAFAGSWTNYAAGYVTGAYRKDQLGQVHVRGLVAKLGSAAVSGDVIATLPAGYRPPLRMIFPGGSGGPTDVYGRIDVLANGEIVWIAGGTAVANFTSLDAISFWTD
jgi:hypothetical protein